MTNNNQETTTNKVTTKTKAIIAIITILIFGFVVYNAIYEGAKKSEQEFYDNQRVQLQEELQALEAEDRTLRPTFKDIEKFNPNAKIIDLIKDDRIKQRIISEYSGLFYNRLYSIASQSVKYYSTLKYYPDSNCYKSDHSDEKGYSNNRIFFTYYADRDKLTISIKQNGYDVLSSGKIETGKWERDYFNNQFGEDDKDSPFIYIKLYPNSRNGDYLTLRVSNAENAWAISYRRDGDYESVSSGNIDSFIVRDDSTGAVHNFDLTFYRDMKYHIYVEGRDQVQLLIRLLNKGVCTISFEYESGFTDYRSIFTIKNETKHLWAAIDEYL